jgi:hypothetical protein
MDLTKIYNAIQTSIYYWTIPVGTLTNKYEKLTAVAKRLFKDRITTLVAVNLKPRSQPAILASVCCLLAKTWAILRDPYMVSTTD